MKVFITPQFSRMFRKLESNLQIEALEKIFALEKEENIELLRIHKLKGRLKDRYSFSVNYKTRIIFNYLNKSEVVLLAIGDHDIYQ